MRHDENANSDTVFNLMVGMSEAACTNHIFTNGFATCAEMYIMAVEVPRDTRFVNNMPEWPNPQGLG